MSTGEGWSLDRDTLAGALERWKSTDPPDHIRELVNEWLMDLVLDPLHRGREDDARGIFFGRVVGTNVGVTYVPDIEAKRVYVSDIYDVSDSA